MGSGTAQDTAARPPNSQHSAFGLAATSSPIRNGAAKRSFATPFMISRGSPSPSQAARCCMHRAMLRAFAQPAADQSPRSDKPG
ncbi:hypothetical protein [Burkholderia pseudomallei]|uniref:hypothetical protein n=1 Tax=Burkholderia pseudomallei TaxID=28450 RepID=UPI0009044DCE|nr:hypothetical protein [Burkholderia pseudomallei]